MTRPVTPASLPGDQGIQCKGKPDSEPRGGPAGGVPGPVTRTPWQPRNPSLRPGRHAPGAPSARARTPTLALA